MKNLTLPILGMVAFAHAGNHKVTNNTEYLVYYTVVKKMGLFKNDSTEHRGPLNPGLTVLIETEGNRPFRIKDVRIGTYVKTNQLGMGRSAIEGDSSEVIPALAIDWTTDDVTFKGNFDEVVRTKCTSRKECGCSR